MEGLETSKCIRMCSKHVLGTIIVDPYTRLPNQLLLSSEIRWFLGSTTTLSTDPFCQQGFGGWRRRNEWKMMEKSWKNDEKNRKFYFLFFVHICILTCLGCILWCLDILKTLFRWVLSCFFVRGVPWSREIGGGRGLRWTRGEESENGRKWWKNQNFNFCIFVQICILIFLGRILYSLIVFKLVLDKSQITSLSGIILW